MKRILVIGSCGAGKSTFSKQLHDKLGIELIHLDQQYWQPNWTRTGRESFREKVAELVKKKEWIIDGNYRNTMDIRFPMADTIIFLDRSPLVCFYRILKRRFDNKRADPIAGCKEKVTFELMKWVLWRFPMTSKKEILQRIAEVKNEKRIIILKSDNETTKFIRSVS